jgi:hypothetical protein
MVYQICWTEKYREKMRYASTFDTLDGYDNAECGEFPPENRKEAFDFVMDHLDDLQMFAPHETGSIYGYCVETSDGRKPTAILIKHSSAGWIWIEIG